jgi:ribosomal protein S12 methylthiotransferase accessory factor YcaO
MEFWTSGANEGDMCELEQAHTWCALGTRVQRKDVGVPWTDVTKQPSATERCVTLQTKNDGSFGLGNTNCDSTKSVLCEVEKMSFHCFNHHDFFPLDWPCSLCATVHPAQQHATSM